MAGAGVAASIVSGSCEDFRTAPRIKAGNPLARVAIGETSARGRDRRVPA